MKTTIALLAVTAATAAVTACSAAPVVSAPSAGDVAVAASQRLSSSVAACRDAAAAEFAGGVNDPARELAQLGCERSTCESLGRYIDGARFASRDPRYGQAAADWLEARWSWAGCLEVQARSEAAG